MAMLVLLSILQTVFVEGAFNFEIEKRVYERISEFMDMPVKMLGLTEKYSLSNSFSTPFLMPNERDNIFNFMFALSSEFQKDVFYGQEDGLFIGYVGGSGTYLEGTGSGGYKVNDGVPKNMIKYFDKCIDPDIGPYQECMIDKGEDFLECVDDCQLDPCPGNDSKIYAKCTTESNKTDSKCKSQVTLCPNYKRNTASKRNQYGYIPRYYYCLDKNGKFTDKEGAAYSPMKMNGTCHYENDMRVNGTTPSPESYAYCSSKNYKFPLHDLSKQITNMSNVDRTFVFTDKLGGINEAHDKCDDVFVGGYKSKRYDPRMRPWYEGARIVQESFWSKPYPFATVLDIGISYTKPLFYLDHNGYRVFRGAFIVDYELRHISDFLTSAFANTATSVLVVEDEEPNYIIGSSTGSSATKKVRADNETIECSDVSTDYECKVIRATPEIFASGINPLENIVLVRALAEQKVAGYPKRLITSKGLDNKIGSNSYVSQSLIYERVGENLRWRIIIVMPAEKAINDSILPGDPMFVVVLVVALLGFIGCIGLFYSYFSYRRRYEIALSDWRFTSAFIVGCAVLNLSSLTLLGRTTDAACMIRMWSFHFFFVLALTPLLVKVWRMNKLMEQASTMRRSTITTKKAVIYTLPAIIIQIVILTVFSILDPWKRVEYVDIEGNNSKQHIVCQTNTINFFISELVFEGILVFAGCFLAFQTRNLGSDVGDAKPLALALYNVALVAIIILCMVFFMNSNTTTNYVIKSIAVFWATIVSSCVFVLPRLLRVKNRDSSRNSVTVQNRRSNTCM